MDNDEILQRAVHVHQQEPIGLKPRPPRASAAVETKKATAMAATIAFFIMIRRGNLFL